MDNFDFFNRRTNSAEEIQEMMRKAKEKQTVEQQEKVKYLNVFEVENIETKETYKAIHLTNDNVKDTVMYLQTNYPLLTNTLEIVESYSNKKVSPLIY